jgi:hypothetical protein
MLHFEKNFFPQKWVKHLYVQILDEELFALFFERTRVTWWVGEKMHKMLPKTFLSKLKHNFYREKSIPKIWDTTVIFKKMPTVNNCPLDKNLSNLVTLAWMDKEQKARKTFFFNWQLDRRSYFLRGIVFPNILLFSWRRFKAEASS